jgi:nucleoid-associated protein YgaU
MTLRRYARAPIILYNRKYGTSQAIPAIRENVMNGTIQSNQYITKENERLDIIAGKYYGDGTLWWIIAAASGIGWGLQMPAGTILKIPSLSDVKNFVG